MTDNPFAEYESMKLEISRLRDALQSIATTLIVVPTVPMSITMDAYQIAYHKCHMIAVDALRIVRQDKSPVSP